MHNLWGFQGISPAHTVLYCIWFFIFIYPRSEVVTS